MALSSFTPWRYLASHLKFLAMLNMKEWSCWYNSNKSIVILDLHVYF